MTRDLPQFYRQQCSSHNASYCFGQSPPKRNCCKSLLPSHKEVLQQQREKEPNNTLSYLQNLQCKFCQQRIQQSIHDQVKDNTPQLDCIPCRKRVASLGLSRCATGKRGIFDNAENCMFYNLLI